MSSSAREIKSARDVDRQKKTKVMRRDDDTIKVIIRFKGNE